MPWLREGDTTHTDDTVLYGKTFADIMLLLENDRDFMYPEEQYKRVLSTVEKMKLRKIILRQIAMREFTKSVQSAMETLEEYAEDLIKITAPREKVIDGDVKTLQGWMDSCLTFQEYVREDDYVSRDIIEYFANELPPHYYDNGLFQYGEPYDSVNEGERYATFAYCYKDESSGNSIWQYMGHRLSCCEKRNEIENIGG